MTRTVAAGEFKAKCLKLIDEVNESGESLVVTKRGKPVVEVRPAAKKAKRAFGAMKDEIIILGDIIAPVGEDDWEIFRDDESK